VLPLNKVMKKTIIILHGWGLCGLKYKGLSDLFKKEGYEVYAPDMPGFGSEPLCKQSNQGTNLTLSDYVDFLDKFIRVKKIQKPILLGHSFGGRVAIKYAYEHPEKILSLILTGVPVIRERSFKKKIAFLAAVTGGKVFSFFPENVRMKFRKGLYFLIGEWDYYNSGKLKNVFKNIISEDLIQYLKEIKNPIVLIWGSEDRLTPAFGVPKIKKIVPQSKSVIIKGIGHKLPYEDPLIFVKTIKPLL